MLAYRTPGVRFEWLDRQVAIQGVRTDIAGFVGIASRGPLHKPVRVESWTQFVSAFGGHVPQGFLAYGAEGFFENGGRTCWIVRVADPDIARAAQLELLDASGKPVIRLEASTPGVWSHRMLATVIQGGGGRITLSLRAPEGRGETWPNLRVVAKTEDVELLSRSDRSLVETLNDITTGSQLVRATRITTSGPGSGVSSAAEPGRLMLTGGSARFIGGHDGLASTVRLTSAAGAAILDVIASSSSSTGAPIDVTVTHPSSPNDAFDLEILTPDGRKEEWPGLTMCPRDQNYAPSVVNDPGAGSRIAFVRDLVSGPRGASPRPAAGTRKSSGGLRVEHLIGDTTDRRWGLESLERVDEVAIVAMPDIMPSGRAVVPMIEPPDKDCSVLDAQQTPSSGGPEGTEFAPSWSELQISRMQQALAGHCVRLRDRMAILDARRDHTRADVPIDAVVDWRSQFVTSYAALYFPWLQMPDPLKLDGLLRDVPPSAHVAGVYARGDLEVGVHKPPANAELAATIDTTRALDDIAHGDLNNADVNAIRTYPGRGIRVFGARTMADDSRLRYINVRRLLLMIAESIDEATQWTVFEPNDHSLWRDVARVVRNFLDGLWRQGMLDGPTADDAYSVKCDETTNPPEEIERGRLICLVGVQPPWPAEFVTVRIGVTESGAELIEEADRNG